MSTILLTVNFILLSYFSTFYKCTFIKDINTNYIRKAHVAKKEFKIKIRKFYLYMYT